jgi:hypothetical protein
MLALLAGVPTVAACGSTPDAAGGQPASGPLRFSVITSAAIPDEGLGGGARGRLARDSASAVRMLRALGLERAIPAARAVDYGRRSVVIVLAGSVPDTAYRVAVRDVSVASGRVEVRAAVRRRAGAMGGMAISRPYVLLTVDRDDVAGAGETASVHLDGP